MKSLVVASIVVVVLTVGFDVAIGCMCWAIPSPWYAPVVIALCIGHRILAAIHRMKPEKPAA